MKLALTLTTASVLFMSAVRAEDTTHPPINPALLYWQAAALLPEAALNPACCEATREFGAIGCACDEDVETLLVGLGLLPAGAPAGAVIKGILNLAQASACATNPAYGGPIFDACTGSSGCGGAAST